MKCVACGSNQIERDGVCVWSAHDQKWEFTGGMHDRAACQQCGSENIVEAHRLNWLTIDSKNLECVCHCDGRSFGAALLDGWWSFFYTDSAGQTEFADDFRTFEEGDAEIRRALGIAPSTLDGEAMLSRSDNSGIDNAEGWLESLLEMVANLASETVSRDDAERVIHESALSVLVRDGWREPGGEADGAEEYEITLTSGGPGLRIRGKLNRLDEPDEWPRLEWSQYATPWTEYVDAHPHRDAMRKFVLQFHFGEG